MRSSKEIIKLVIAVAAADDLIRAVSMEGSRVDPAARQDQYQDFDITYYVTDMRAFYNNPDWVTKRFGELLIMQMPEAMRRPDGGGHFNYMMIFPDGTRLDLTCQPIGHVVVGEPSVTLLDKDSKMGYQQLNGSFFNVKPPSPLDYYSCCNDFWWCLNNVARGIARDELAYVMGMLNTVIRPELHDMVDWHIGAQHDFQLSTGKLGRYYKQLLSPEFYARYAATYSDSDYANIQSALYIMCDLFHELAVDVAMQMGFSYRQDEEDGMRSYLGMMLDV